MYIFINKSLVTDKFINDNLDSKLDEEELAIIASTGYHIIDDLDDLDCFRIQNAFCPLELNSISNNQLVGNYILLKRELCSMRFQREINKLA